ncbi:RNA polymerase sigma-70 factor [Pedobacter sp. PLR]|uniref:RNA polymerase sigma-70 factor n=1 Tax=Pedobacter sp. PLR TaxID=2994465 RepID=UPI002245F14D|nr:RNA polymerase sigma-70 factor [Pedobacter sp. PLR]MCX2451224.1 RNA polymerase sigma-70 factor [Pedobacter sp. PLR]
MTQGINLSEKEIEHLFVNHYSKMVGFTNKFVPMDIAENIVQDVFFQLLKKVNHMTINTTLEGYVYRAIKNKYLDHVKSQQVHLSYIDKMTLHLNLEELEYFNPDHKRSLLFDDDEMAVFHAIEKLPEKCRIILKAKYFDQKRNNEIADEQGISIRTVETQIYKAMKQLKTTFKDISLFFLLLLIFLSPR